MFPSRHPLTGFFLSPNASRYFSLVLSFLVSLHCGTMYVFAIYSVKLASLLNTDNVALISALSHAGYLSSVLLGVFFRYFGYQWTMIISLFCVGMGNVGLVLYKNYSFYCVSFFIIGLGSGGIKLAITVRNTQNFSIAHRGIIMGILVGGVAASGLVWLSLFQFALNSNVTIYFFVLGLSALVVGSLATIFVEELDPSTLYELEKKPRRSYTPAPIETPATSPLADDDKIPDLYADIEPNDAEISAESDYVDIEITNIHLLRSSPFWILFAIEFVSYGVSLAWSSEMGIVLGNYQTEKLIMIYLFVGVNALFRFLAGFLSDLLANHIPRSAWMFFSVLILFLGHLVFIVDPSIASLWVATILIAIGYGIANLMLNLLISIIYGKRSYGFNDGVLHIAGAFGGIFFTQISYALAAAGKCGEDKITCYRTPFLFGAAFLIGGIALSAYFFYSYPPPWLVDSTSKRYKKIENVE